MVVIEPVPIENEQREKIPKTNPIKNEVSEEASTTTHVTLMENSDGKANSVSGYESDGFETASETELDHDDDIVKEEKEDVSERQSGERHTEPVASVDSSKGSEEEKREEEQQIASNMEQVDEKVLMEANNAKLEGNALFKDGLYEDALLKYKLALELVPDLPSSAEMRSVFHANSAACFSKLGKFEETIKECSKALDLNPKYIKVLLRRAEAYEKLENFDEAIADMKKILEEDPSNDLARRTVIRLQLLADAEREKMKEEMIGMHTSLDGEKKAEMVHELHAKARQNVEAQTVRYEKYANKGRKEMIFEPGEWVWLHFRKDRFPAKRKTKLHPRGDGPYEVLERINNNAYKLDIPNDWGISNSFNVADLSPYDLRTDPSQPRGSDVNQDHLPNHDPLPTHDPLTFRVYQRKKGLKALDKLVQLSIEEYKPKIEDCEAPKAIIYACGLPE